MGIICLYLNYGEADSPGAPLAFQRSTKPYQVCCSYTDCSFVPGRSHYVRMPFMIVEENVSGKSIVHEYGEERVKQAQLFPGFHSWLSSLRDNIHYFIVYKMLSVKESV